MTYYEYLEKGAEALDTLADTPEYFTGDVLRHYGYDPHNFNPDDVVKTAEDCNPYNKEALLQDGAICYYHKHGHKIASEIREYMQTKQASEGDVKTLFERVSEAGTSVLGDNATGTIGGMAAGMGMYSIPVVGTGLSLADAGANFYNAFRPDKNKSWSDRLGDVGWGIMNLGTAAAGLVGAGGAAKGLMQGLKGGSKILRGSQAVGATTVAGKAMQGVGNVLGKGIKATGLNNKQWMKDVSSRLYKAHSSVKKVIPHMDSKLLGSNYAAMQTGKGSRTWGQSGMRWLTGTHDAKTKFNLAKDIRNATTKGTVTKLKNAGGIWNNTKAIGHQIKNTAGNVARAPLNWTGPTAAGMLALPAAAAGVSMFEGQAPAYETHKAVNNVVKNYAVNGQSSNMQKLRY